MADLSLSIFMTINYQYKNIQSPTKITLTDEQSAGHADHWRILTDDMSQDVPEWLQKMLIAIWRPALSYQSSAGDERRQAWMLY